MKLKDMRLLEGVDSPHTLRTRATTRTYPRRPPIPQRVVIPKKFNLRVSSCLKTLLGASQVRLIQPLLAQDKSVLYQSGGANLGPPFPQGLKGQGKREKRLNGSLASFYLRDVDFKLSHRRRNRRPEDKGGRFVTGPASLAKDASLPFSQNAQPGIVL